MYTITNIRKFSNLSLAYDRLVTNPESTYKNYFRSTYSNFALALNDNIKCISHKMKSGFMPEISLRAFMPKSNGLSRMYTILSIEDQIVYQAFANIIAEAMTNKKTRERYKKSVFGNLYTNKNSVFFYEPWKDSYIAYTRAIIKAYKSGLNYIASFDLTACYDSINHNLIKNILIKNNFSENCASEFIRLLGKWESADGPELGTGIPQGPQASGIIAEMVLGEYDKYIEKLQKKYKFKYYRYVDDIRILAESEETVKWILFLLDKKSKELGLFPQSSKINVHMITDINLEIKSISQPLLEEEFDEDEKHKAALKNISVLLKREPVDLTAIRRYFHLVKHTASTNRIAIKAVSKHPNLVHSFAYYLLRYPRKIPSAITNYIYESCKDKAQQFSSGILLEAIINNMNAKDTERFSVLALRLLKEDSKNKHIVDCRFKAQLIVLALRYGKLTQFQKRKFLSENNWWIVTEIIYHLDCYDMYSDDLKELIKEFIVDNNPDISLMSSRIVINNPGAYVLPQTNLMSPVAQNTLKRSGVIQRNRYSNSQINRYLSEILGYDIKFSWKKKLGKEHDQIERNIFTAMGYWKTDLTAFVNIWDTIDDRLCFVLTSSKPELGGYVLGKIGAIESSRAFRTHLPKFHLMAMEIHKLRLHSYLSHSEVKRTHEYTGPIKQKERSRIVKLIKDGLDEISYFG